VPKYKKGAKLTAKFKGGKPKSKFKRSAET